jgi:predicted ATPase
LTQGKLLPNRVLEQIVAHADGMPLFIEELTKTVIEGGLLRELPDHYELLGPLPPLAIPSTLHASLLARLDRLVPVKDVAQIASVIGRDFSYPLLAAVAGIHEKDLLAALRQLADAELMSQRGAPPDAGYQFKHALVQDAAYDSLVRRRRLLLHSRIAQALEASFANSAFAAPEIIGHHYASAGLAAKAVAAWQIAGERAISRSAVREAVAHFSKALDTLVQLPDRRLELELALRLALVQSLNPINGWSTEDVQRENERAIVLCEQIGDKRRLLEALVGRWVALTPVRLTIRH